MDICVRSFEIHAILGKYILQHVCDDVSTIFVDGKEMTAAGTGSWNELATLEIPASTDGMSIGIKCRNTGGGPYGIMAQVTDETGEVLLVTDSSWRCSDQAPDGWSAPDFSEAANWDPARVDVNQPGFKRNTGAWQHFSNDRRVIWAQSSAAVAYCRIDLPKLIGKYFSHTCTVAAYLNPNPSPKY